MQMCDQTHNALDELRLESEGLTQSWDVGSCVRVRKCRDASLEVLYVWNLPFS